MKIVFFIVLLTNIIFFLWEINSGALNPQVDKERANNKTKQIFLLSELPRIDQEKNLIVAANKIDINVQSVSTESNSAAVEGTEPETIDNNQTIEMATASIKAKPEDSGTLDNQLVNDDIELTGSQQATDNLITTSQTDSIEKKPVLEEKTINHIKEDVNNSLPENNNSSIKQAGHKKTYCYQVGSFANQKTLNDWVELNKISADSLSLFNKDRKIVTSYLVYYPPADTYAKSRENIQLLKKMGITDYWLFRKSELKGAISLGLFGKEKRAIVLKEKFADMGLDVVIKRRYKTKPVLFAQILTKQEAFKDTIVISDKQIVSKCKNNAD